MKRWRSFSVRTIAVTLLLAVSFSQMSITAYDNEFDTGAAADIGGEINTQLLTERNTIKRSSLSYDVRQVAQMDTFSGLNSRNIWYIDADNGFHSYNLQTGEDQSVDLGCEISDMARYGNFGMYLHPDGKVGYIYTGSDNTTYRNVKTAVDSGLMGNIVYMSAGDGYCFFINDIGELWACGSNSSGQLGLGDYEDAITAPRKVMDNVIKVSAGRGAAYQACYALTYDGKLYGWGHSYSLGPGHETTIEPTLMKEGIVDFEMDHITVAAITTTGELWAWGVGMNLLSPVSISKKISTDVIDIAFDGSMIPNLYFLRKDGTLWRYDTIWRTDQQIDSGVVSISSGKYYCPYVKADGSLYIYNDDTVSRLPTAAKCLVREVRLPELATAQYYSNLNRKTFRIIDPAAGIGEGPTEINVTVDGVDFNTGTSNCLSLDIPDGSDVVFSKPGYHTYRLPQKVMGTYNVITLIKDDGSGNPIIQSELKNNSTAAYKSFSNLRFADNQLYVTEGSRSAVSVYVYVDWNGGTPGDIWLQQGDEKVALRNDMFNSVNLGTKFTADGGSVALYARSQEGKISRAPISIKIGKKAVPENMQLNAGQALDINVAESLDVLGGAKLELDLNNMLPIEIEIKEDNTFQAAIGLSFKDKLTKAYYEKIKDAVQNYKRGDEDAAEDLLNAFKRDGNVDVKKSACKFAFSCDVEVLGYMEGSIYLKEDGSIGLNVTEDGLFLKITGETKYTCQTVVMGVPAYWTAALEVALKVEFPFSLDNETLTTRPAHLEITVGFKAEVGVGVVGVATVGVKGGGKLHFKWDLPISPNNIEVYMDYSVSFLNLQVLGIFDVSAYEIESDKVYIYNKGSWFSSEKLQSRIADATPGDVSALYQIAAEDDLLSVTERKYSDNPSVFSADSISDDVNVLKTNIYTYASPELVAYPDGRKLLVWVDDDGAANRPVSSNKTALYYSFYNGEVWSDPRIVEQDGTADTMPRLKMVDGTAHLAWVNSNTVFQDESADINGVSETLEISYAYFDVASQTFKGIQKITENAMLDMSPEISSISGNIAVTWLRNTENDVFMRNSSTDIMCAQLIDGVWKTECILSQRQAINKIQVPESGETITVVFSEDTDGDYVTTADTELFLYSNQEVTRLTDNTWADTKPVYQDGVLYWYSQDGIQYSSDFGQTVEEISLTNNNSDDFWVISSPDGTAAILYVGSEDGYQDSIYGIFNDGNGWGNAIPVTEDGGNVTRLSAVYDSSGVLEVAAAVQSVDYEKPIEDVFGETSLKLYRLDNSIDLVLDRNFTYDALSMFAGNPLKISGAVTNHGSKTIDTLQIHIYDNETLLDSSTLEEVILPGETKEISFSYLLPEQFGEEYRIVIEPKSGELSGVSENDAALRLRLPDISVEEVHIYSDSISSDIVNRGAEDMTDVVVRLVKDSPDGEILDSVKIPSILRDQAESISFPLDASWRGAVLYIIVEETEEENLISNNSGYSFYPVKHTVSWNIDGVVTKQSFVEGTLPEFDGIPQKLSDDQHDYTFSKWDKTVQPVTGDVTYTAIFVKTPRRYKVTFYDEDGETVLGVSEVEYGKAAQAPENPTKPSDGRFQYVFLMWDADFSCVTRELEVKAVYRAIPIGASGLTLKESASHLSLAEGYLHGVRDNVTAGEIIQSFENSDAIVIVNQTGKRLASSEIAGTGCWVQLMDDSSVLDAVQIIVRGDTNGDGVITTADYMRVRKLFRREIELVGAEYLAANTDGKGDITTADYMQIRNYFAGTYDLYAET